MVARSEVRNRRNVEHRSDPPRGRAFLSGFINGRKSKSRLLIPLYVRYSSGTHSRNGRRERSASPMRTGHQIVWLMRRIAARRHAVATNRRPGPAVPANVAEQLQDELRHRQGEVKLIPQQDPGSDTSDRDVPVSDTYKRCDEETGCRRSRRSNRMSMLSGCNGNGVIPGRRPFRTARRARGPSPGFPW